MVEPTQGDSSYWQQLGGQESERVMKVGPPREWTIFYIVVLHSWHYMYNNTMLCHSSQQKACSFLLNKTLVIEGMVLFALVLVHTPMQALLTDKTQGAEGRIREQREILTWQCREQYLATLQLPHFLNSLLAMPQ